MTNPNKNPRDRLAYFSMQSTSIFLSLKLIFFLVYNWRSIMHGFDLSTRRFHRSSNNKGNAPLAAEPTHGPSHLNHPAQTRNRTRIQPARSISGPHNFHLSGNQILMFLYKSCLWRSCMICHRDTHGTRRRVPVAYLHMEWTRSVQRNLLFRQWAQDFWDAEMHIFLEIPRLMWSAWLTARCGSILTCINYHPQTAWAGLNG